jgi:predicted membrane channel-forming protein YqfA (hemolysin III family)
MDKVQDFLASARILLDLWKPQKTLCVTNVPPYLHEPGILSGYRLTNQSWFYYAKSIFHMHNETFNIWTHLIGFLLVWMTLAKYALIYNFWEDKVSWPMLMFGAFCLFTMAVSTFAHIFHTKSLNIHYTSLFIDYIGASLYGFGSGLLALYVFSDDKTYDAVESIVFPLLWIYAWFDFVVMCVAKVILDENACQRKFLIVGVFIVYGVLVTIPVGHRYWVCFNDTVCSLSSLNHLSVIYIMFLLTGFTFGSHLPELIFPGIFDIVGHSHQLFHVVSTSTQILQIHTAHNEISKRDYHHGNPDLNFLLCSTFVLLVCQILSLLYLRRYIAIKEKTKGQ